MKKNHHHIQLKLDMKKKKRIDNNNNQNMNYFSINGKQIKIDNDNLPNPNINSVKWKNPIYSFTKSKRFNSTTDNFDKKKSKYALTEANTPLVNYYDYNYTQSFLKAETSFKGGSIRRKAKRVALLNDYAEKSPDAW